jgi:hypothetical protein
MNDEVDLPSAKLVPRAAEIERRSRDLLESKHDAVEVFRAFHVGDADGHVMQALYFNHDRTFDPLPTFTWDQPLTFDL